MLVTKDSINKKFIAIIILNMILILEQSNTK